MSLAALIVVLAAVIVGSCVQGSLGFGLGLVAAPVAAIVDPRLVPGPLLFAAFLLTVLVARRERGALDWHGIRWALVGRVPGTLAGTYAVAALPQSGLIVVLACGVLAAVALSASGWRLHPNTGTLLGAGAASGFMGTVTSIGGPPMALVYQRHSGAQLRATLAAYFVVGAAFSLVTLVAAGEFGGTELWLGFVLVPAMIAGFALSQAASRYLDRGYTRAAVLSFAAVSSAVLLVSELA